MRKTDWLGKWFDIYEELGECGQIAFAVKDIGKSLKEVESKGIELINKKPISGAENLEVAFLHPKSTYGVLTEFCEHNK